MRELFSVFVRKKVTFTENITFEDAGDWGELWTPNLAQMFLIEFYGMLQNFRVTVFTIFELLRENQLVVGGKITSPPPTHTHTHTQIRVKNTIILSKEITANFNHIILT